MTSIHETLPLPPIAFTGNQLARLAEKREADAGNTAINDASALFIAFSEGKPVIQRLNEEAAICHFSREQLNILSPDYDSAVLLGHLDGKPRLALPVLMAPDRLPAPFDASDIRPLFAGGFVPAPVLAEIAQAAALLVWNANCRFCGKCGSATRSEAGGYKRVCTGCDMQHFPRTDPVTIMLATHGDRCLLARSPRFPEHMVSCLAGFVEPGETIEEAVRRETHEEAGITIGEVTYVASQPWPFPHSMMIGCMAEAIDDVITIDRDELEHGGWFTRQEVRAMAAEEHPKGFHIPPPGSIAHYLIRRWIG